VFVLGQGNTNRLPRLSSEMIAVEYAPFTELFPQSLAIVHSVSMNRVRGMSGCGCSDETESLERATLWLLLAINGVMFLVEASAGWWSESTGLLADSLDMFADALVYGIALYAVGQSSDLQSRSAKVSGWLQITLGVGVFVEVVRRFVFGSQPVSIVMIAVGATALAANVACLMLLAKHRKGGVHMRASWIFSTNDVIANIGVIASGALVMYFGSRVPDLIVGAIVSALVVFGGYRILLEVGKESTKQSRER
jgi:Co/Zn/Cd efflux system component